MVTTGGTFGAPVVKPYGDEAYYGYNQLDLSGTLYR